MEQTFKPGESEAESKALRRLCKEAERAAESSPLDPWERYRALNDLVDHPLDDYYEVWRAAPAGAINREMALQVHLLARTTAEKYAALRKVYGGVMIPLGLTAVFLVVLALHLIAPSIV